MHHRYAGRRAQVVVLTAGRIIDEQVSVGEMGACILEEVLAVCGGRLTRSEALGHREFATHYIGPAI